MDGVLGLVIPVPDRDTEPGYVGVLLRGDPTSPVTHAGDHLPDGVRVLGAVEAADLGTELDDARFLTVAVVTEDGKDHGPGPRGQVQVLPGSGGERLHHHVAVTVLRVP